MKELKKIILAVFLCITMTITPAGISSGQLVVEAAVNTEQPKTVLLKGQKADLKTTETQNAIEWKSTKPSVARVSENGIVTAKKSGKATVSCKTEEATYRFKVIVQAPVLSNKSIKITKGKTCKLSLRKTDQKIVWKSSNNKIASVSRKGVVKAKRKGTCKITATVLGKKYSCKVTVNTAPKRSNGSSVASQKVQTSYVWLSATGTKYHRIPNCGRMNPNTARQVSLAEVAGRYAPCSNCF